MKFTRNFKAGEILFREGDDALRAYYIVSGGVRITVGQGADVRILAELAAGQIFGEMGLIDDRPRLATATAITDITVEVYDDASFEAAVLDEPERMRSYLATILERLRTTDALLSQELLRQQANGMPSPVTSLESAMATQPPFEPSQDLAGPVRIQSKEPFVDGDGPVDIVIRKFPFRIGRMSLCNVLVENELHIEDDRPYNVSRGHCAIERRGETLLVRDRGSMVGTVVNGTAIGTDFDSFVAELKPGTNSLILGNTEAKFHFTLEVG